MNISEFIGNYKNHPVLFIGSGLSFRYLKTSYTWDKLLSKICKDLYGNDEVYLDIKSACTTPNGYCSYSQMSSKIETKFNDALEKDRNGKFKAVNDLFYQKMRLNVKLSRLKIYIAQLLSDVTIKEELSEEISELKKVRKNISSIITTNYDTLVESIFEFNPLVGNNILLSNPYGSVYKIHGCINDISQIIITEEDYKRFDEQYELIRAQMLSLFIHNPIIFLGYNVGDENVKKVLKTIFSYVPVNTPEAEKVRQNFLLVEYDKGSVNQDITEHDIIINGSAIRINKLKTDDYISIYQALANLTLPISAMDVRKVQSIVKEIYAGGSIKVMITEDIDSLKNSDRILAIGSSKTISYQFMTIKELAQNYFTIIEESNASLLSLINKQTIAENQYFPIYGFSRICTEINDLERLKQIQDANVDRYIHSKAYKNTHSKINDILEDGSIAESYKYPAIMYALYHEQLALDDVEQYLKNLPNTDKQNSNYRRLLCLYDIKKYK